MVKVKEIFYSPYELSLARGKANAVSESLIAGVLLKVCFDQDQIGFSCLQTWPTLGGSTLLQSLNSLQSPTPTSEARQALRMAEFELNWRFLDKRVPPSRGANWPQHRLVNDLKNIAAVDFKDFKTLKIKMHPDWHGQIEPIKDLIRAGFRLRLDYNNQGYSPEVYEFLQNFSALEIESIDFIEDPFVYDFIEWKKLSEQKKVSLAWDFQTGEFPQQSHFVFMHKPMRDEVAEIPSKTIVTSNMDHPVGQRLAFMKLLSLVEAQKIPMGLTHGLNSHLVFNQSAYSEQMGQGAQFGLWTESGVGFSELLKDEAWKKL